RRTSIGSGPFSAPISPIPPAIKRTTDTSAPEPEVDEMGFVKGGIMDTAFAVFQPMALPVQGMGSQGDYRGRGSQGDFSRGMGESSADEISPIPKFMSQYSLGDFSESERDRSRRTPTVISQKIREREKEEEKEREREKERQRREAKRQLRRAQRPMQHHSHSMSRIAGALNTQTGASSTPATSRKARKSRALSASSQIATVHTKLKVRKHRDDSTRGAKVVVKPSADQRLAQMAQRRNRAKERDVKRERDFRPGLPSGLLLDTPLRRHDPDRGMGGYLERERERDNDMVLSVHGSSRPRERGRERETGLSDLGLTPLLEANDEGAGEWMSTPGDSGPGPVKRERERGGRQRQGGRKKQGKRQGKPVRVPDPLDSMLSDLPVKRERGAKDPADMLDDLDDLSLSFSQPIRERERNRGGGAATPSNLLPAAVMRKAQAWQKDRLSAVGNMQPTNCTPRQITASQIADFSVLSPLEKPKK
ncbi:hypothetical protein KIPB_006050, partial [Kipferlia bialata]